MRQYDIRCVECGGLIADPSKVYGYSGSFCRCSWVQKLKTPDFTYSEIRKIIREELENAEKEKK